MRFCLLLQENPDTDALRETFLINQLLHAGHRVHLADKADFEVNDQWFLEVGGKAKKGKRGAYPANTYFAINDIDAAAGNNTPL